jgi:phospholipase A1
LSLSLFLFLLLNASLYSQEDKAIANAPAAYRISSYKGIYVIAGHPDTKIQASFKYQITSYLDLYIGYTQTMFWEINQNNSSWFKDINFNPDLFYRIAFPKDAFVTALDFGLFEHKSDGKGTRSWDGSYFRLYTITKFYNWSFNWDTKLYWFYKFQLDQGNADIKEYSGFWDSKISFINYYDKDKLIDRISFYFDVFPGGIYSQRWNKGGQELGIKFRVGGGQFYPSIFLQFYHGYNESLLDYNIEHTSYRVGIAF